jgi:hypothetical protein
MHYHNKYQIFFKNSSENHKRIFPKSTELRAIRCLILICIVYVPI